MKFDDETICNAINISWMIAHKADNEESSIRRWVAVANELQGFFSLLNWSANSPEDRKILDEIAGDIIYLKTLAEYNAYGI